jgi:hypothetical protein
MKQFKDFLGRPLAVGDKVVISTSYFMDEADELLKGKIVEFRAKYDGTPYIVATFKKTKGVNHRDTNKVTFTNLDGHELIKYE